MTRRAAVAAFILGLLVASPALADCTQGGQSTIEGARTCEAGIVAVCSAGEMLRTVLTCRMQPGAAAAEVATPASPAGGVIAVKTATYSAGNAAMEFVFRLRGLCDGRKTCAIVGDATLLQDDPAPRQRGQFNIIYACVAGIDTITKQIRFAKGAAQVLTCVE